ncbi:MAG: hypothetical protein AB1762_07850 [Gemmatimonadota bacterium]
MTTRIFLLVAVVLLACVERPLQAQDTLRVMTDTTRVQVIRLSDGSTVIGRVTEVRGDSAVIRTQAGTLVVARAAVLGVRERAASTMRGGQYWPEDPNATRLFFASTGRMLRKGEGYFCDIWLLFLCLTGGITDRLTIGGGMSVVPGIDISDNIFYLTPKIGLWASERFQVAVGAFAGWTGAVTDDASSFGILYGVGTYGTEDQNISLGAGYAYWSDDIAEKPMILAGIKMRMSRGIAFISENYLLPGESENGIISFGLRFFNERISGDVGFVRLVGADDLGVGIPFVGLAVRFR